MAKGQPSAANPRRAGPHLIHSRDRAIVRDDREVVDCRRSGIGVVLSGPYIVGSVMLWLTYFMGLVIFYALINWMPLLFKEVGLDPQTATLISALFPLGGCGAVLFGWLMDRFNANRIIAIGYALTAVFIYSIGLTAGSSVSRLMLLVFVAGVLMNTAQSSMPALAAAFYPTRGRATGVAWMLGIGQFGGIAGSFLVAELFRRNLSFGEIFAVVHSRRHRSGRACGQATRLPGNRGRCRPEQRRNIGPLNAPAPGLSVPAAGQSGERNS